ncbi:aspartic-type endopeptidase [Venturia nashicola]|nr:aspartic-type endopeptidase [Venturia nashicola]
MYRRWEDATEHPTYNATPPFTSQSYPDANEHLIGSLYIELEGGYNTTISHTELESVERGQRLDGLGEYAPLNNGRIMASVGHGPADYGTDFGMLRDGVFLASTYVFVDYESNKFGLAPAVLGTMKSNIKKQCSKHTNIPPALISTETNSTHSSNSTTKAASAGLSASDKIAIGVSIPAGVAGIATLLYVILPNLNLPRPLPTYSSGNSMSNRRKRKAQKQKEIREAQKLELEKCRDQSERRRNESLAEITRMLSDHAAASPGSARSPSTAADQPWGVGSSPSMAGPEIEGIEGNTANGNST